MMGALGKPLFLVHNTCAPVVKTGAKTLARVAWKALEAWGKKKAPKTVEAVKFAGKFAQEVREEQEKLDAAEPVVVEAEVIS